MKGADVTPNEPADDLKTRVARVLAEDIRPVLAMDGVEINVVSVEAGVARVRLDGVCTSCPGIIAAIMMGIEQELRRHLPEVEYLEVIP